MAAAEVAHALGDSSGFFGTEERLTALARGGGALRRVLAALAVRCVDGKAWDRLGYARLSDYARERLGVSGRSLQEWARVGRRLDELPCLEAALVSGALPWSKVRLLARFVTAGDEAGWIALARPIGVRALERELRAVDRGTLEAGALATDEEGGEREPTEVVHLRGSGASAFKWQRTKEYASRVSGERVPAAAVLEMVTAETLSSLPLDGEAPASPGVSWAALEEKPEVATVCAETPADADPVPDAPLPAFLLPLLAGLASADAFDVDARLRRAVRLEQRLDAEIAPLLRVVTASEFEWKSRYFTLAAFARERLGMSPRKARALLRLERVGDVCPALRAAYREGRISWVKAQVLAPLLLIDAAGEWRGAWVEHAQRVTVRRLEAQVDDALLARETDDAAWQRHRDYPERFGEDPTGEAASVCANSIRGEGIRLVVRAPTEVARLFRAALCTLRRAIERETGRLPTEGDAFEAMLDHALQSWGADDPWLNKRIRSKYRVFERDGWQCTVPGCTTRKNLHSHHIEFRSAGGTDADENRTTLCATHHQRGVHEGRLRITGQAPNGLTYELGLRPGLPPLERYRSGDRVVPA